MLRHVNVPAALCGALAGLAAGWWWLVPLLRAMGF